MASDEEVDRLKEYGAMIGLVVGIVVSISLIALEWSRALVIPISYPWSILLVIVIIIISVISCYYTPNKWGI